MTFPDSCAFVCFLKGYSQLIILSVLVILFQVQSSALRSLAFCHVQTGKGAVGFSYDTRVLTQDSTHTGNSLSVPTIYFTLPRLNQFIAVVPLWRTELHGVNYRKHSQ
jgi:hypothetical protein